MALKDRIKMARELAKLNQSQLAAEVRRLPGGGKFQQQHVSKLERGEALETSYIVHIAMATRVRPEWLACEMGQPESLSIQEDPAIYQHDARLSDIIAMWTQLPPAVRKALHTLVMSAFPNKIDDSGG